MTLESSFLLGSEGVPNVACKVIITSKEESSRLGEVHGGDSAEDAVVGIDVHLSICANVKEAAGGVVRTSSKGMSVGEELNCINVRLVSHEGLAALFLSLVPQFGIFSAKGPRTTNES